MNLLRFTLFIFIFINIKYLSSPFPKTGTRPPPAADQLSYLTSVSFDG
jgi:hypothetical protein